MTVVSGNIFTMCSEAILQTAFSANCTVAYFTICCSKEPVIFCAGQHLGSKLLNIIIVDIFCRCAVHHTAHVEECLKLAYVLLPKVDKNHNI